MWSGFHTGMFAGGWDFSGDSKLMHVKTDSTPSPPPPENFQKIAAWRLNLVGFKCFDYPTLVFLITVFSNLVVVQ